MNALFEVCEAGIALLLVEKHMRSLAEIPMRADLAPDHVSVEHRNGKPPLLSARLLRHNLAAEPRFVRLGDTSMALEYAFRAEGDQRAVFLLRLEVDGTLRIVGGPRIEVDGAAVLDACLSAVLQSHLFRPEPVPA